MANNSSVCDFDELETLQDPEIANLLTHKPISPRQRFYSTLLKLCHHLNVLFGEIDDFETSLQHCVFFLSSSSDTAAAAESTCLQKIKLISESQLIEEKFQIIHLLFQDLLSTTSSSTTHDNFELNGLCLLYHELSQKYQTSIYKYHDFLLLQFS